MSLGRWVSEEDVTISKQTFRAVLYTSSEDLGAKNFVTWSLAMLYFLLETFPKVLIIKRLQYL